MYQRTAAKTEDLDWIVHGLIQRYSSLERERARITWNVASPGRKSLSLDVRFKDLQFILYS